MLILVSHLLILGFGVMTSTLAIFYLDRRSQKKIFFSTHTLILGFEFISFEFSSVRTKKSSPAKVLEREKIFYKINNYLISLVKDSFGIEGIAIAISINYFILYKFYQYE